MCRDVAMLWYPYRAKALSVRSLGSWNITRTKRTVVNASSSVRCVGAGTPGKARITAPCTGPAKNQCSTRHAASSDPPTTAPAIPCLCVAAAPALPMAPCVLNPSCVTATPPAPCAARPGPAASAPPLDIAPSITSRNVCAAHACMASASVMSLLHGSSPSHVSGPGSRSDSWGSCVPRHNSSNICMCIGGAGLRREWGWPGACGCMPVKRAGG